MVAELTVVPGDVGLVPEVAGVLGKAHAVRSHVLRLGVAHAGATRPVAAVVRAVLRLGAALALFPAHTHGKKIKPLHLGTECVFKGKFSV